MKVVDDFTQPCVSFLSFYRPWKSLLVLSCRGLTQQLATKHWMAAHSPIRFPPQWDGEEKWTKGETHGLG